MKGGSPQIRRGGDDTNVIFSERGSECSGVAMERNLYKEVRDIDVYIEFEMLKVKVPIKFLGTVGFLPRREGR